jgi:hypothetical protein
MQAQQLTGTVHISSIGAVNNHHLAQQADDLLVLGDMLPQMLRHQIMKLPSKDDTRKQTSAVESEILMIQQEITSHQHTYQVSMQRRFAQSAAFLCA